MPSWLTALAGQSLEALARENDLNACCYALCGHQIVRSEGNIGDAPSQRAKVISHGFFARQKNTEWHQF
jgi:hypothetical protein